MKHRILQTTAILTMLLFTGSTAPTQMGAASTFSPGEFVHCAEDKQFVSERQSGLRDKTHSRNYDFNLTSRPPLTTYRIALHTAERESRGEAKGSAQHV